LRQKTPQSAVGSALRYVRRPPCEIRRGIVLQAQGTLQGPWEAVSYWPNLW
jgi:hypothetical protein